MKLSCCASCGIAEVDDVKLVPCDGCDLVKYCGDECQRDHKSQHEEECKKRAAELRDELLFKQPKSTHMGECPICVIPLPIDPQKCAMWACCSKLICRGCAHANFIREEKERLEHSCPFCRKAFCPREEADKRMMKRIEANDPVAIFHEGVEQYKKGDYDTAFEYYTKAAELGDAWAHSNLAQMYRNGEGVEKDEEKVIYHWEEAAIAGHPYARYNLGVYEWKKSSNAERAVKHFIIAATQGDDDSIKTLMRGFQKGYVSKDDLAAALRAHQAAVDATKSPQRDAVE